MTTPQILIFPPSDTQFEIIFIQCCHICVFALALYSAVTYMIVISLLIMNKHFCFPRLDSGWEFFSHGPNRSISGMIWGRQAGDLAVVNQAASLRCLAFVMLNCEDDIR